MNAFEKWSVWVTSVLTGLTGIGYFWAKYLVESSDPFSVVNHPLEPWFLKAHIVLSPLLLVALGTILVRHVWKHIRLGVLWGRKSGLLTAGVLVPMVVSGYLIQAVTHLGWLEALAITHIVTGAVYVAGLGLHQLAVHFMKPKTVRRRSGKSAKRRSAGAPATPRREEAADARRSERAAGGRTRAR